MKKIAFLSTLLFFICGTSLAQAGPSAGAPSATNPDFASLLRDLAKNRVQPIQAIRKFDSSRVTSLIRDGVLYLSAQDAIELALENNLDIASARLLGPMADSDIKRASAGQLLRNVPLGIVNGPATASGPLAGASASGYEGAAYTQSGLLSGLSVQLAGSPIPQLDPVFYATGDYSHNAQPEENEVVAGTSFLLTRSEQWKAGVQKAFLTGTSVDLHFEGLRTNQNSPNNTINPAINADYAVKIQQPLLQGASLKANARAIHIAANDKTISRLTFESQVSATVSQVLTLYYDLVTFRDQLKVIQDSVAQSEKFLGDSRKRLDMGVITQSDVIAVEAEVATNQQLLKDAEIQVEQQEITLKDMLTRRGLETSAVLNARIMPTDHFMLHDDVQPVESLEAIAERAIHSRPEVKEGDLELTNSKLSLLGTREALKPTLNVYASFQSNGLGGALNSLASPSVQSAAPAEFIGGFGQALSQIGQGAYPDYEFGFQLNVPLRNRAAQADMMRDQIDMEQQQINTQEMKNGIRLQALRGALALRQARERYETSQKLTKLAEEDLSQQQKMFDLGTVTAAQVIDAAREYQLRQRQQITAFNTCVGTVINMDAVLNETLSRNHVVIDKVLADAESQPDPSH